VLEKPELAFAFAFFAQPLKRVFNYGRAQVRSKSARRQGVEASQRDGQFRRRFRHPIVPGNKFHAAAAFVGMRFLRGINEKIWSDRSKSERNRRGYCRRAATNSS
jgi:hypothetical protein